MMRIAGQLTFGCTKTVLALDKVLVDWVTVWGTQYSVTTVRQANPYGLIELSPMARQTQ
jgi:hypothetical protein